MKWFQNIETLPEEVKQLILHNSRDMNRFYTLSTQERQDVLDRIRPANIPDEPSNASKRS
ncbi:MAG: hypothetical protein IKI88_03490 [Anaerotignum sp.]|nr:hypothetical protein [Anaerotignum sp.]